MNNRENVTTESDKLQHILSWAIKFKIHWFTTKKTNIFQNLDITRFAIIKWKKKKPEVNQNIFIKDKAVILFGN